MLAQATQIVVHQGSSEQLSHITEDFYVVLLVLLLFTGVAAILIFSIWIMKVLHILDM